MLFFKMVVLHMVLCMVLTRTHTATTTTTTIECAVVSNALHRYSELIGSDDHVKARELQSKMSNVHEHSTHYIGYGQGAPRPQGLDALTKRPCCRTPRGKRHHICYFSKFVTTPGKDADAGAGAGDWMDSLECEHWRADCYKCPSQHPAASGPNDGSNRHAVRNQRLLQRHKCTVDRCLVPLKSNVEDAVGLVVHLCVAGSGAAHDGHDDVKRAKAAAASGARPLLDRDVERVLKARLPKHLQTVARHHGHAWHGHQIQVDISVGAAEFLVKQTVGARAVVSLLGLDWVCEAAANAPKQLRCKNGNPHKENPSYRVARSASHIKNGDVRLQAIPPRTSKDPTSNPHIDLGFAKPGGQWSWP